VSAKAERFAALQSARAAELEAQISRLLTLRGEERALDVGTGAGALAFALAPRVREVVAVDADPAMLAEARAHAPSNVELLEAGAERLPFDDASFDLVGTLRTLHHVRRAELAVAELTRVARPGGVVFVVDQIAPVDPLAAVDLNRFERARDPSTSRILSDGDLRALFDANGLVLRRAEFDREQRDLDAYLDLAGCEGRARDQAKAVAPRGYTAVIGWYVLSKPDMSGL
jgi:SAM-dependent methyltransferase